MKDFGSTSAKRSLLYDVLIAVLVGILVVAAISRLMPTRDARIALKRLRAITVAPELRCAPYDPGDYSHPTSIEQQVVSRMEGRIYGPYSGRHFPTTGDTDIEHIVAKSEAHDSGLCAATASERRSFARDLDNLTLASPEVNRHQKSDRDAAGWLPPLAANRCWFADRVTLVRERYDLTVDREERDRLKEILRSCKNTTMVVTPGPESVHLSGVQLDMGRPALRISGSEASRRKHRAVPIPSSDRMPDSSRRDRRMSIKHYIIASQHYT